MYWTLEVSKKFHTTDTIPLKVAVCQDSRAGLLVFSKRQVEETLNLHTAQKNCAQGKLNMFGYGAQSERAVGMR
jgi:hypothetical protein